MKDRIGCFNKFLLRVQYKGSIAMFIKSMKKWKLWGKKWQNSKKFWAHMVLHICQQWNFYESSQILCKKTFCGLYISETLCDMLMYEVGISLCSVGHPFYKFHANS